MGAVYRGTDTHLFNRPVAVKILVRECDNQKYLREAEALSKIHHPSVTSSYDWGLTDEGCVFTVFEMVTGKLTPISRMIPPGGLDFVHAARLIRQLGQGLSAIHDQGIIHQDLHLVQIQIRDEGSDSELPLILDFGKARLKEQASERDPYGATAFWPPEQFAGITSEQSDIYSLSAIAYYILTGRQPRDDSFWERSPLSAASWTPDPRRYRFDLPSTAERVLLKSLARNPKDRHARAETFGDELADALALGPFAVGSPPRQLSVFLSYASADKERVRDLFWKLRAEGLDVWFDEVKLLPGQDWRLQIETAVRRSDAIIVCLSTHAVSKEGYFQKEVREALNVADEKPEGTIFLIPLRLDACPVPHHLSRWQWVDLFNEGGLHRLLDALRVRTGAFGR